MSNGVKTTGLPGGGHRSWSNWARCNDCGAEWNELNAHGVAVQHHRKTGHWVDVTVEMSYYPPKSKAGSQ